jgi:hypothetical protein
MPVPAPLLRSAPFTAVAHIAFETHAVVITWATVNFSMHITITCTSMRLNSCTMLHHAIVVVDGAPSSKLALD